MLFTSRKMVYTITRICYGTQSNIYKFCPDQTHNFLEEIERYIKQDVMTVSHTVWPMAVLMIR